MYYPKKNCHITLLSPHNGHLSTRATFFCPQGGLEERFEKISTKFRLEGWTQVTPIHKINSQLIKKVRQAKTRLKRPESG